MDECHRVRLCVFVQIEGMGWQHRPEWLTCFMVVPGRVEGSGQPVLSSELVDLYTA